MATISKNALKKSIIESVYNEILTKTSRYYYYLGNIISWGSGDTPEQPLDTYQYELESRNHMVAVKQLNVSDVSYVVRRINWTSGTAYDMFDDSDDELPSKDFYVMTDEFNVYKCIFNTGAVSTVKPTGSDSTSQSYSDGYIWKFLFNVPVALRNKFMTSDYIPVMNALNNQFYSDGEITSVTVDSGGTGYTSATVSVTGNGTGATFTPIISGGSITGCVVNNPGSGYTTANLIVTGNGTGAALTPNFSVGDINTLQANVELQAIDGSIEAIKVGNTGANYTSATVTITGNGTGATASATILNGAINKIMITDVGVGYTSATVTITGNGTGATARAIISPKGGHGKNAVGELYTNTLMFSTTISEQKNQGLVITNDFRQVGLIKNISEYGSLSRFKSLNGSACFKIATTLVTAKFPKDTIVYQSGDNKQFLVVESFTNSILLQSIDNAVPTQGSVYRNSNMDTFTAGVITEPTINKFSGDLLYIDNRVGVQPTQSQAVNFRTTIGL